MLLSIDYTVLQKVDIVVSVVKRSIQIFEKCPGIAAFAGDHGGGWVGCSAEVQHTSSS